MSPLDPIFQVNELPSQLFPGLETPSTYPLPQLLMSEATTIYLNIWRGRLPSASLGICPLPLVRGDGCCQCRAALLSQCHQVHGTAVPRGRRWPCSAPTSPGLSASTCS